MFERDWRMDKRKKEEPIFCKICGGTKRPCCAIHPQLICVRCEHK